MQTCGSSLFAILDTTQRDLLEGDLIEFYPPDETNLCPVNAEQRFATAEIEWLGWKYDRQEISRSEISRFIDGKFNNVNITLSNVDRAVGTWLSTINLEGYRVLIRCISRSVSDDSIVLGVFRCEKAFDVDNVTVGISAKQDLGSIENDLPWGKFNFKCPLTFKGTECLAGQSLGSKSSAYQAATVCNKSWRQCQDDYANGKAFQGTRYNAVSGSFKVSQRRGGAGGALLSLIGLGNKRVTKQYSSQDDTSQGQVVTLGLGRTGIELSAVKHADTGQYLAGQWVIGEGPITKILNLRNVTSGWASTFQALSTHLGLYGYDSSQGPQGFFASDFDHHSHRAYVEATIKGDNPDTGDPAPTLAATILWITIPGWTGSTFGNVVWSDNPVEHLRFLLTEQRSLNYNSAWIDDTAAGETVDYCNEPLIDQSGGEDVYISSSSGTAGTSFKRYRSTGILDTYYFRKILGLTSTYSAEREVTYNTYTAGSNVTATPGTYYRKRYTSNFHIREATRATDFIFKSLLASFRGYLITSAQGKLQIRSEKPTITTYIRNTVSVSATVIDIEDASAWKALNLPVVFALVGVGLATSETRKVSAIAYSTAGNSITLSASGGATASGSTLAGGSTTAQAAGRVTCSGGSATAIIDGVSIAYVANSDDTAATVAAILTTRINANQTLNRYVVASWTTALSTVVVIKSKLGTLTFSTPLTSGHAALELTAHVHMPFSDVAFGALTRGNISQNGFKWPLGGRQTTFNQFKLSYQDAPQDYQLTELHENDEDHQEKINKIVPLEISGACVDNYHQASRLVLSARYKYREGDYFAQITTTDARALLLEEGDVICCIHSNQPGQRNLMLRIEELKVASDHKVSIIGRLYADAQFPTAATERTVPLVTGIGWSGSAPGEITPLTITSAVAGTLTCTFLFAAYIGTQAARIEMMKSTETAFSDTGIIVNPDPSDNGTFSVSGIPSGITTFRITPYSAAGDGPSTVTAFDDTAPIVDVLEYQIFEYPQDVLQIEVFS